MKRLSLGVFLPALFVLGLESSSTQSVEVNVDLSTTNAGAFSAKGETSIPVTEAGLRSASAKAIRLIQHSQAVWYTKQTCTSCHHQLLTEIPINLARESGVPIDQKIASETTSTAFAFLKDLDAAVQGYDYIDVLFDGYALAAANVAGIKPNLTTAASAQFIASRQLADGSWPTMDSRPPQSHSQFTTTAVCALAIRLYLPERMKVERDRRLLRARQWLLKSQPRTTEDRTFQLLGLYSTGGDETARAKAARQLLAQQRKDGGWGQLPDLASDAYATGEVLFALHKTAGLLTGSPAYQRGLRFLLETQQPDGSWRVKSRLHPPAPVSPPYVDVGFPYEHDQFVSIMGTSWATSAMLLAVQASADKPAQPAIQSVRPAEDPEWMRIAVSGSAADLKRLLDAGMKPDSKTGDGTTALMLAAHDLEKVKFLLARGADPNLRAASGITPLMIAARYRGNGEVLQLLLKSGAKLNTDKGVEVRNDASAVFFAVMAGDPQMVGVLLDAGATLDSRMKILGQFVVSPLNYATFLGDARLIEYLIARGADPNEVDGDRISMLGWATIANRVGVVQALLARGANVNHVDKYGMTPLLYAASIDFGDTVAIERLISAGADLKAKNKEGLTAFDLAKRYRHRNMMSLLATKSASR